MRSSDMAGASAAGSEGPRPPGGSADVADEEALEKQKKASYCSVMNCNNNSVLNPSLGFFKIPSNSQR